MRWASLGAWALLASLSSCATVSRPQVDAMSVLEGPQGRRWTEARVAEGARTVFSSLATDGPRALSRLRLRLEECERLLTDIGRRRAAGSLVGNPPRAQEHRWATLQALASSPVTAWCARGVQVVEPGGPEGFAQRALVVERLLVVGREEGGLWGVWIEGLVLTREGWRVVPWVRWSDAVERPRRDHTDVALWDCDMASGPSRPQP